VGGVETYEGVLPTHNAIFEATGNKMLAIMGEKFITIPIDQIVAIFIAAIVITTIPKKYFLTSK